MSSQSRDYQAICEGYIDGVLSGRIAANELIKLACLRHLSDLRESPYIYSAEHANRACEFIEMLPHTKGRWAMKRERLILQPWQVFGVCMIFGWIKESGFRRFREAYIQVARKNGKSALAAGIGLYCFVADGEFAAECYSGATTERQAWEVFGVAKKMAEMTPEMVEAFGIDIRAKAMAVPADNSKFQPVIGNPGDGSSPSCAIIDEYHEHNTPVLYDTMRTGMGARDNPLILIITTAGTNTASPCYERFSHCKAVLDGTIQDDEVFAMLYGIDEGDDWTDPAALEKANPNLDVSVNREFLLSEQRQAKENPAKSNIFRIKHLNQWVNAKATWLNTFEFSKLGSDIEPEDYAHLDCILSIDFASKLDICAGMLTFSEIIDGQRHYYCFPKFWLPSDTVESDKVGSYVTWRNAGLLEVTDGAELDYGVVLEWVRDQLSAYKVNEVAYDPWRSNSLIQELIKDGAVCVEFRNTPKLLTDAMRETEAAVASHRLHYKQNAILQWMAGNAVLRQLPNELTTIIKEHHHKKIDGISALLMGIGRAQYARERVKFKSVYEYTSL